MLADDNRIISMAFGSFKSCDSLFLVYLQQCSIGASYSTSLEETNYQDSRSELSKMIICYNITSFGWKLFATKSSKISRAVSCRYGLILNHLLPNISLDPT